MRKLLLGSLLLIFGIGLGIGAAYGFNKFWRPTPVYAVAPVNVQAASVVPPAKTPVAPSATQQTPDITPPYQGLRNNGWGMGNGMMDDWGWQGNNTPNQQYRGMGPGMMGGWNNNSGQGNWGMGMMGGWNATTQNGQRIAIDLAIASAKQYAAGYGQGLTVAEIMEFNNNFYASVKETSTGRGAFELLVDPYSGAVYPEMGPNMMWNVKYGHMGNGQAVENTLSIEQAIQQGQQYLDANLAGAQLQSDGTSFYGYYTFDFKINDQVAGMLSVNGFDGSVWLHTWHGQFVAEQEVQ
ncbi:MAG TPA: hypothetical protein PKD23_01515 [Bellilinea sp.]|jgi:hypothetical protein|nr:hypothetical protein [Anaerolineaceae bacterium]HML39335.1 hypothetical protein [Bellilinea sp.]HMN60597.1 hypothetical protein [Anaerolinea sp.]